MKTLAIVHGWSEGPWQSRRFCKELAKTELQFIKRAEDADVIVAHSEGCYWVPRKNKASLILLIGIPHWPGRHLFTSVILNLKANYSFARGDESLAYWFTKLTRNLWYIITRPYQSYRVLKLHNLRFLPRQSSTKRVVMIRNHLDTFTHPKIDKILDQVKRYKYVEYPGVHDDCWSHPHKYIELIENQL